MELRREDHNPTRGFGKSFLEKMACNLIPKGRIRKSHSPKSGKGVLGRGSSRSKGTAVQREGAVIKHTSS